MLYPSFILGMANICFTSLSIQKDNTCVVPDLSDEATKNLVSDIEETCCYDGGVELRFESENLIECDIATRWAVPVDELQRIAKVHDVKIRAVGREDGMGFVEVACINPQGELVQHESIDFAF